MRDHGRLDSILVAMCRQSEGADLEDAQLLERFRERGDEPAFAEIVRRHGRTVMGAARAVLRNESDLEDVFQTTFLILARKAGEVRKARSLGSWLYGVARRVALDCRSRAARRARHERIFRSTRQEAAAAGPEVDDLRALLSEELARLPEKYRAPLVLCYLEGKTNEQAAAQLRWPAGTVRGRIARVREILRHRLARRGLALNAGAVTAALESGDLLAAVRPELASATVRAAAALARGLPPPEALPSGVTQLVRGEARAMTVTKIKTVGVLLVTLGLTAGIGVAVAAWQRQKPNPEHWAKAPGAGAEAGARRDDSRGRAGPRAEAADGDEKLKELARIEVPVQPTSLTWSPDGKYIAGGTWMQDKADTMKAAPSEVYVVNVAKEKHTTTLRVNTWVTGLAFSADGKWLAVAGARQGAGEKGAELVVFDVPGFAPKVRVGAAGTGGFTDLCWAPDSRTLYALDQPWEYDAKAAIRRWSVPTFREQPALTAPQTTTYKAIAVSADGTTVAAVDQIKIGPGVLRLFDVGTGKQRTALESEDISSESTLRIGFTPDGRTIGALRFGDRLTWWDVATGKPARPAPGQRPFRFGTPFSGRSHHQAEYAISPDGRTRLRGRERHSVLLFDTSPPETYGLFLDMKDLVTSKERTWRIYDPNGSPSAVAFSPDGKRFAACVGFPQTGTIILYATPK